MIAHALSLTALVAVAAPAPQEAQNVVARYEAGGEKAVVTRDDLALEVAFRKKRSTSGEDARNLLVDRHLVEDAARAAELSASRDEIEERIATIRDGLRQQGRTFEEFLESAGMSAEDFERNYVALSIAHEKLVMKALGLDSRDAVTQQRLELWLREERARRDVVEDPDQLPEGVVARIDGEPIELVELGRLLLTNLTEEERAKHVRRIVLRRMLDAKADELGIEVDAGDTRAEVERRRKEVEKDPRFRDVPYEQWLRQTQGLTVDDLVNSEQMVATVQQREIVARLHPDDELKRELAEDRERVMKEHGSKRKLSIVLIRAADEPNAVVERDFEAAREQAVAARERLATGLPFAQVAAIYSEDPYSKVRGGDIGEFFQADDDLMPAAVLDAAFSMRRGEVSDPIRVPQGFTLVQVTDIVPAPDDTEIVERMREERGRALLEDLLEQASIEMVDS